MAKKYFLVLLLVIIITGAASAQFMIEGSLTGLNTPAIGVGYEFPKFDVLGGIEFYIYSYKYEYENFDNTLTDESKNNYSYNNSSFGIYAGIAPKATLTGNWSLSFPLLARIRFSASPKYEFDDSRAVSGTSGAGSTSFGIDLRAGARASYAFSEHWSLYTGFLFDVISWYQTKYDSWKTTKPSDGTQLNYTYNGFGGFGNGTIQLGVCYKF